MGRRAAASEPGDLLLVEVQGRSIERECGHLTAHVCPDILRQDPDNPDLPCSLGLCNADPGRIDSAIDLLRRCHKLALRIFCFSLIRPAPTSQAPRHCRFRRGCLFRDILSTLQLLISPEELPHRPGLGEASP
ncbi:MAG TPA: hypothetical protein PLY52_09450 [Methanothrix sp.]|uniref:hypothetical protein n=1 Tax=Methanothrix sp. TaxID=90426 RepID=UPI002CE19362|nr:hypothetical protein [Methanothrix sp.]MDI9417531.1 hypothetical protein [Euryarchaeota archaeon]HON36515.1 hypothetical protein [Methanothrix sp.]HRU75374.1 hypothetical protein [Methanothrix sp.]